MVEMTEAANILNNATDRSLILMDEIGRGTSTFDGLALAWAVARHIARVNRSLHAVRDSLLRAHERSRTRSTACANVHLDATEHRDGIVFLHAVKEGPASRSYGLAVAQLAGVPREVIAAAREYLAALEKGGAHGDAGAHNPRSRGRSAAAHTPQAQLPLEPPAAAAARSAPARARSRTESGQRRRPDAARRARPRLQAARAARIMGTFLIFVVINANSVAFAKIFQLAGMDRRHTLSGACLARRAPSSRITATTSSIAATISCGRFHDRADYAAFFWLIAEANEHVSLPIIGACVMPNHVHFVVRPTHDTDLALWTHWLFTTHARRYHKKYETVGPRLAGTVQGVRHPGRHASADSLAIRRAKRAPRQSHDARGKLGMGKPVLANDRKRAVRARSLRRLRCRQTGSTYVNAPQTPERARGDPHRVEPSVTIRYARLGGT